MHFFRRKNRFLLREASRTSDSAFPASSSFYHLLTPKGGTKSVRQAKSSGNGRRMHLKRYSASSRPRFRRRIRRPFFFPLFRNAESVVRCAQLRLFVCVRTWQIYGLRDCTAKIADEVTSSARAPGAGVQNSAVFCARSASAGGGTRYFSQCLIFWCFWIKPKAQKKKIHDRRNRFFGKNSDAKIGCTVSAGRSLRNTPAVAGLRWRRLRPARRKGAATPDSGRAADRTEKTSAGKRRER